MNCSNIMHCQSTYRECLTCIQDQTNRIENKLDKIIYVLLSDNGEDKKKDAPEVFVKMSKNYIVEQLRKHKIPEYLIHNVVDGLGFDL